MPDIPFHHAAVLVLHVSDKNISSSYHIALLSPSFAIMLLSSGNVRNMMVAAIGLCLVCEYQVSYTMPSLGTYNGKRNDEQM